MLFCNGRKERYESEKNRQFFERIAKRKNITQEQFAEKLNVSGRTVSRWETGRSMPDISLLVEIADFYEVDVREIMEGERKSETMDEELRDVANKMADYADDEKGRLLKVIQIIGFAGVFVATFAIVLQCVNYSPSLVSTGAILASFLALVAMVIITLYVAGVIEKLVKKKRLIIVSKVLTVILLMISLRFLLKMFFMVGIAFYDYATPFQSKNGIENYNKQEIVQEYEDDMDSAFKVFPDTTDNMLDASFESSTKTGIFDSDGYFILEAQYGDEEFDKELNRLEQISCEITHDGEVVTKEIRYDEELYNYPAYIANDGFDFAYEYALIDKEKKSIVYVVLSYPKVKNMVKYRKYMKKDLLEYNMSGKDSLYRFTIYAHRFSGTDYWSEYSDKE